MNDQDDRPAAVGVLRRFDFSRIDFRCPNAGSLGLVDIANPCRRPAVLVMLAKTDVGCLFDVKNCFSNRRIAGNRCTGGFGVDWNFLSLRAGRGCDADEHPQPNGCRSSEPLKHHFFRVIGQLAFSRIIGPGPSGTHRRSPRFLDFLVLSSSSFPSPLRHCPHNAARPFAVRRRPFTRFNP